MLYDLTNMKTLFKAFGFIFYTQEAKISYYFLSSRMFVTSNIYSDSNSMFFDSIVIMPDILSGA